jgi:diguanylate cyclase (GGDEF)-like protein/putative nucleotidyltransferase with HDIG domain
MLNPPPPPSSVPPHGGQQHRAREFYERAMLDLDQDAPPAAVGALLLQIARSHMEAGQASAAIDCTEAVLGLPVDPDLLPVLAEVHELRGRLFCQTGSLDAAIAEFEALQHDARGSGHDWLVALGEEHLAAVHVVRAEWSEAITRLERAAQGFSDAGDDAAAGRTLQQLAILCVDLKRWNSAEHALADALARASSSADLQGQARLELIRARMALDRANVERGRMSAERALELARRSDDAALVADAVAMTGAVARDLGDIDRSLTLFDDAERQARALGDDMLLGELAVERVESLARRDQHPDTLRALNRAYRALARLLGQTGSVERARRLRRLEAAFLDVTQRWAQRFEAVDHDTAGHVQRVADLTCEIARRMGVDPAALIGYRVGAFLHDIGKLQVPATVLNKRGRLTAEEWALVKRHPMAGAELLAEADFPWEVRPIVESHHECWDGSGYPHGRAGDEIPLAARVFCVADVFDALVNRRPFKHALGRDEAVDVMRRDVGRQFDPAVFRVFEDVVREGVPIPGVVSAATLPATTDEADDPIVDDPLTSVAEIGSWSKRVARMLATVQATGASACIVLVDIDDFARVNSAYGRLQGDDVLWAVAKVLQRGLRSADLIGRRSADEFVALLPDTDTAEALDIAERVREGVANLRCVRRDALDETIAVSASIAIAAAPGDGPSLETLLAAADRAMFAARREGGDRVLAAGRATPTRVQATLDFSAFVGREEELRHLTSQLDLAGRGEPRLVGIIGEAGIGKSALARELEPEVRLRGGLCVTGQASLDVLAAPLAPWAAVVTRLAELCGTGERHWPALAHWLPAVFAQADPTAPSPTDHALQQEIAGFVRRAARAQVVTVVLEDMHVASPASWAVLDTLASSLDDERLLTLCVMRPEVQPGVMEWRRRLQQHVRWSTITPRRFSLDEVRRWIRAVFHDAAPGDDVARWVHALSEGIPKLGLHLLQAGCEAGTIYYGGTRWEWQSPDEHATGSGAGWVLERRLERLSAGTRELLAAAALLRHPLSAELLVAMTGASEAQVRTALDEGLSASVLVTSGGDTRGSHEFAHPLLAEACVRTLPERQRQATHELAARVLELRAPSAVEAIAGHYHAAGDDAAAFAFATQSAERSLGACVHDRAFDAMQVAQRYAPSSAELARVRVRHAEMAVVAGRYSEASALCDLALEWLDRQPPDATTMRGRRIREWTQLRRGRSLSRSADTFRTLLDATATIAPEEAAATALVAADAALERADWTHAAAMANYAMQRAVGSSAPSVTADALVSLGLAEFGDAPDLGLMRLRQAVERTAALQDPWHEVRALHALGDSILRSEATADGEDLLVAAIDKARASHHPRHAARISRSFGVWRSRQGNFKEAVQWLGDADRLFATMEDEPERLATQLARARCHRDAGERARAYAVFDAAARKARELGAVWVELAALSGAALSNGGAESPASEVRWARAGDLIADAPPNWWFPGRELVDAFAVRMAMVGGHVSLAHDLFAGACDRLATVDPYGNAWLVSECAQVLERAGVRSAARVRAETIDRTRRLGFTALTEALS